MKLISDAIVFARDVHKSQVRKYTNEPYVKHLAEVAGIVSGFTHYSFGATPDEMLATAWLHDCMEDQYVQYDGLLARFGRHVADGVEWLSDMETGTRKERKAASCHRLSLAPDWVKTIKCADLISNTESIVLHDPDFAKTYLCEKRDLLDVLKDGAHPVLWGIANELCDSGLAMLSCQKS